MAVEFVINQLLKSSENFINTLNNEHLEDMIYLQRIIRRYKKSCLKTAISSNQQ